MISPPALVLMVHEELLDLIDQVLGLILGHGQRRLRGRGRQRGAAGERVQMLLLLLGCKERGIHQVEGLEVVLVVGPDGGKAGVGDAVGQGNGGLCDITMLSR